MLTCYYHAPALRRPAHLVPASATATRTSPTAPPTPPPPSGSSFKPSSPSSPFTPRATLASSPSPTAATTAPILPTTLNRKTPASTPASSPARRSASSPSALITAGSTRQPVQVLHRLCRQQHLPPAVVSRRRAAVLQQLEERLRALIQRLHGQPG